MFLTASPDLFETRLRLPQGRYLDLCFVRVPVEHDWGDLPWRVFQDPSGNELCVLHAH